MIYEERPAERELDGLATRIWYLDAQPVRRYEKILPMPFVHLIVNLSEPYRIISRSGEVASVPGAFVSGLQSEYLVIESPRRIRHVGVELSPVGLSALAADPGRPSAGLVQDAESLLSGATSFAERAREVDTAMEALASLQGFIGSIPLRPVDTVAAEATRVISSEPDRPITAVAARLEVSVRVLTTRFRRATGTTPKQHAQVVRFHRLVDAVHAAGGTPRWADLAVSAGYYDQPEVIRAFRRFSGWTPAEYYRIVGEHGPDAAHFVPLDQVPVRATVPRADRIPSPESAR